MGDLSASKFIHTSRRSKLVSLCWDISDSVCSARRWGCEGVGVCFQLSLTKEKKKEAKTMNQ